MTDEIPLVENKVFSRMYVNPSLRDVLRVSKLYNRPIAALDFIYDNRKGN